jgi:Spy/CpxP family protein refolding chaperone
MSSRHLPLISLITIATLGSIPVLANYIPNWQLHGEHNTNQLLLSQDRATGRKPNLSRKLLKELNLNQEQKQKISALRQKYKQPLAQLRKNLSTQQQQLAQMMAGDDTVAAIRNKHQEVMRLQQKMAELHLSSMLEIREVLTLEQRQQFARIMQSR